MEDIDPKLVKPEFLDVALAASDLNVTIRQRCDELALELLNKAALKAGYSPVEELPVFGARRIVLELAKLQIRTHAKVGGLNGTVVAARGAGATWEQIGSACGMSRQGAYDRWGKVVKDVSAQPNREPDPLEKYTSVDHGPTQDNSMPST